MGLDSSIYPFDAASISQATSQPEATNLQSNNRYLFQIDGRFESIAEDNMSFKVVKTCDSLAPITIHQNLVNSSYSNAQIPFDSNAGSSSHTASQPKATDIQKNCENQFQINQRSSFRTEDNQSFKVAKTAFISQVATQLEAIDVQSNSEYPFQIEGRSKSKAEEDNISFKIAKTGDSRASIAIHQNPINSMYVTQSLFDNNTGYHCGGINAAMGTSNMMGTPCLFTLAQLVELEQQIRIYKCINENSPIPSDLLMAISASLNPNQLIGFPKSDATNAVGSNNFQLGASGDNSPKLDRCQWAYENRWRCSKTAIPNKKYCESHIYKHRLYSGKHVEGETIKVYESASGEAAFVGGSASISTPCGGVATAQYHSINFPSDAEGLGVGICVNKVKDPQSHLVTSPATSMGLGFPSASQNFDKPILKFAEDDPDMNLKDYFRDFSDLESQERCSLRHLFDNWPAEQPEYADWSNLSMKNIPIGLSDQTPTSSSSQQKKLM